MATRTATRAPSQGGAAQAQTPHDVARARSQANLSFITGSRRQYAVCPPSNGSGTNQAYAAGATLLYDVPTADGAYLEELIIIFNVNLTLATGTSATYALTAAGLYALLDSIQVQYGQIQASLRPIILKYLAQMAGYERPIPGSVIAGQSSAAVQSAVYATPSVTAGTNNYTFYLRVPLRAIPHSPAGFLPIQGDSTRAQVKLVTAQNGLYGADPLLNPFCTGGSGSGQAVTVAASSTVQLVAVYRDGIHLRGRQPFALDLGGEATCQYIQDRVLTPLSAGLAQRTRLDSKLVHYAVLGILIDGNQSTSFTVRSNIAGYAITEDSVGSNKLRAYGTSAANNVPMMEAWEEFRHTFGQDMDDGVIPFVYAPAYGQFNPSNGMGSEALDMTPAGWNDANLEVWVNSVGAVCTPRMETFLVSLNSAGLVRNGG